MDGVKPIGEEDLESGPIETLKWSYRPAKNQPAKVVTVFCLAAISGLVGVFLFQNPLLGLAGVLILLGSTAEFWLGTRYQLDEVKANAWTGFSLNSIDWSEVKAVKVGESAIRLLSVPETSKLAAFRGIVLRFNPDMRESVLKHIQRRSSDEVRFL